MSYLESRIEKLEKQNELLVEQLQMIRDDVKVLLLDCNWYELCSTYPLSEGFIRRYKDKVDWKYISTYQKLSEDFIREFQDKIDWIRLSRNKKINLSDKFCEEFDKKIGFNSSMPIPQKCWMVNHDYHRTLGPALIFSDGEESYWYRGEELKDIHSDEEYKHWLSLRVFR